MVAGELQGRIEPYEELTTCAGAMSSVSSIAAKSSHAAWANRSGCHRLEDWADDSGGCRRGPIDLRELRLLAVPRPQIPNEPWTNTTGGAPLSPMRR